MILEGHPAWNELRQAVAELSTVSHANGIDYEPRGAKGDADAAGLMPVVATRWNGGRWLAVLELDELLALLALREA